VIEKIKKVFFYTCCAAWFANIGIYVVGSTVDNYDLQLLALINMLMLSFILIRT